jgi:hypothetical protein
LLIPSPRFVKSDVSSNPPAVSSFFFLEHGRSDEKKIAVWQDRLNPLQRLLAGGCNLNRRIDQLIMQAGLTMTKFERFRVDRLPRIVGEMYRGAAVSPTQSESRS